MKGSTDGTRTKAQAAPGEAAVQTAASTSAGTTRVRRKADQAKRSDGHDVVDRSGSDAEGQHRTKVAVQSVSQSHRKRGSKLSGDSQDRLRQAKLENKTVGELADEWQSQGLNIGDKQIPWTHRDSWNHGRQYGYDEGVESERQRIADEDERPARVLMIWKAISIFLFGIVLGSLIATLIGAGQ